MKPRSPNVMHPLVWCAALVATLFAAPAYAWEADLLRSADGEVQRSLLMPRLTDLAASVSWQDPTPSVPSEDVEYRGPRRWYNVVASAVLPGLGEVLGGHKRGFALLALDAGSIYGAYSKDQKGDDFVAEYKAYADAHYSEPLWSDLLLAGVLQPYFPNQNLIAGTVPESVALYVSKEEDEREWYENIGKWDVFAFGWEEYGFPEEYRPDEASPIFDTPSRAEYVSIRVDSKDAYQSRDRFISLSLLLRVFSLLETAYLEGFVGSRYKTESRDQENAGHLQPPQLSWFVSALGSETTRLGIEVRY